MPPGDGGDHAVDQAPWRDTGLTAPAVDACGALEVGGRVELAQAEPQQQPAQREGRAQLKTTTPRATWPVLSAVKPSLIWSRV